MRKSPLNDFLKEKGAQFEERFGVEVPAVVSDLKSEYQLVRNSVGITDFSFMQKFRICGDEGVDVLDKVFAGNVAKIRYCRVLHTFLANPNGELVADMYIANNDEEFIVLCESIAEDSEVKKLLESGSQSDSNLEDLTDSHVLVGIDGCHAWQVVKELFGSDVLGLPYLSVETVSFNDEDVLLFRSGKTSEFGYLIMAPKEKGKDLMEALLASAEKYDGGLTGVNIHHDLRLEGRFFNIFAEGERVKNPLTLGLQWMIDLDKESFLGSKVIFENRNKGLEEKTIGIQSKEAFKVADQIFSDNKIVATVQSVAFSHVLDAYVGLALFPFNIAYAGLEFHLNKTDGPLVKTISMPPIIPNSLNVKLDEV